VDRRISRLFKGDQYDWRADRVAGGRPSGIPDTWLGVFEPTMMNNTARSDKLLVDI
jgi:hypothetical protein